VSERPAVQRGLAVTAGEPEDPASVTPEEQARRRKILYNQRARLRPRRSKATPAELYRLKAWVPVVARAKMTLPLYTGTLIDVAHAMPTDHPTDKPQKNSTPFAREPVPDLPRKLSTGSSGIEPAVATGFCGLMLDAGAWAFMRDKSGDFFPALTPICMVAGAILTAISVVLFSLVWLKHQRALRSK